MSSPETHYEFVQERIYLTDRDDAKTIFTKDSTLRNTFYAINGCGIGASVTASLLANSLTISYIKDASLTLSLVAVAAIFLSRNRNSNKGSNLVKHDDPTKKYMLQLGTEVKRFYGDARKSSFKDNFIQPLLLDAEKIKRHALIIATIGSGKTVLMKGLIEQLSLLGAGGIAIDGKGTAEFAKEGYGLFCGLGREKDFIHINFLDMDNTHQINPLLAGSATALYEILIALLEGEENEWKAKQKEYMKNVLKLLVYQRDYEKLPLDFGILAQYMTLAKLVKEALKYRDIAYKYTAIEDFVQFVSSTLTIDYQDFLHGDDPEFYEFVEAQSRNKDIQGVYDVGMAAQAWRGTITNLKSDYGKVFNSQDPSASMWEMVQRNKFLFVTLPTMASDTTPKELGKLILGLIKGVAAMKAEKAIEPDIPFVVLADEIGSYMTEGFARLMSKSRALGISVWPIFQSMAQIDVVGKIIGSESSEHRELIDVIGTHILMKNVSPDVTAYYNKMLPKKKFITRDNVEKRENIKGSIGTEDHFKVEEEDALKHEEIVAMNNGEMVVIIDGQMHRAVSVTETNLTKKGKKIVYEGKDMTKKIPLTTYLPKKHLFKILNKFKDVA